jgi:hypothetical protein
VDQSDALASWLTTLSDYFAANPHDPHRAHRTFSSVGSSLQSRREVGVAQKAEESKAGIDGSETAASDDDAHLALLPETAELSPRSMQASRKTTRGGKPPPPQQQQQQQQRLSDFSVSSAFELEDSSDSEAEDAMAVRMEKAMLQVYKLELSGNHAAAAAADARAHPHHRVAARALVFCVCR